MALDKFTKQSAEEFVISVSFANSLTRGEELDLSASSVIAVDVHEESATATVLNTPSLSLVGVNTLKIQVLAGSANVSPYKLTFYGVTNASTPNIWEKDISMVIKEL